MIKKVDDDSSAYHQEFGVVMMLGAGIGRVTPPIGSILPLGSAVSRIPAEQTVVVLRCLIVALLAITRACFYNPLFY